MRLPCTRCSRSAGARRARRPRLPGLGRARNSRRSRLLGAAHTYRPRLGRASRACYPHLPGLDRARSRRLSRLTGSIFIREEGRKGRFFRWTLLGQNRWPDWASRFFLVRQKNSIDPRTVLRQRTRLESPPTLTACRPIQRRVFPMTSKARCLMVTCYFPIGSVSNLNDDKVSSTRSLRSDNEC